jgi:hypothetical protein
MLVKICLKTPHWFSEEEMQAVTAKQTTTG